MSRIVVLSTGDDPPTKRACIDSVRMQSTPTMHWILDAAQQAPPRLALENFWRAIDELPADTIVVWLDLDDQLAHRHVVDRVAAIYADTPYLWVTWGQYVTSDGKAGCAGPYAPRENLRRAAWRATHLRTFRASLAKRIRLESLQRDGRWLPHARDLAVMFPLLEMAGHEHRAFVPEVLCVYNAHLAFEANASSSELAEERACVDWVRAQAPYEPLENLAKVAQ